MITFTRGVRAYLAGTLALVCLTSLAQAQDTAPDTLTYSGPYPLAGLDAEASFRYLLDGQDTLLTDTFRLRAADPAALLAGGDSYLSATGTFASDVATGPWQFEFGEYSLGRGAEVADYHYRLNVSGTHRTASGLLREGRLDGEWTQQTQVVEDSQPTAVAFASTITFADGVPQQSFELKGERATLLGRFRRDGLAHDDWTLYADLETQQTWVFREGRLDEVVYHREGSKDTVDVLASSIDPTTVINLDGRYLRLIALWQQLHDRDAAFTTGPAGRLLLTNGRQYARVNEVLGAITTDTTATVRFGVQVPFLPLRPTEVAQLDSITTYLRTFDTIARTLTNNSAFTILETADPEVAYLRATLETLSQDYLAEVRELDRAYAEGVLGFVPRQRYYAQLWPEGSVAPTIVPTSADSSRTLPPFTGPGARSFDAGDGLPAILALTQYALGSADSIRAALYGKLDTRERRQVITALDDQLMYDFGLLDSLIQAQDKEVAADYGLDQIRSTARRALQQYAEDDDLTRKQDRAQELTRCIEDLDALTLTLTKLPERSAAIVDLYTDEVWNNFTATVMEERMQRRVIDAYEEVLPYLRQQVDGLDCNRAGSLNAQFNLLHERMRELRGTDTDELEDRLKRTDDPRQLLSLLGVTPQP